MYKKFLALILCVSLCIPAAACSTQQGTSPGGSEMASTEGEGKAPGGSSQEPLLGADATDEELLEALKDDIHVVSNDAYEETVAELTGHAEEYSGQLYQLEGICVADGQSAYIAKAPGDTSGRLLLKYMPADVEDGERIRVTGIVSKDQTGGETVAALEVIVTEPLGE